MNIDQSTQSAWGKSSMQLDTRALKRYVALLRLIGVMGEAGVCILMIALLGITGWFLTTGNFENAIFTDGTGISCLLDGDRGAIVDVKK